ncbi:spore coat protein YlbD [Priestia endophytica]|uniref:YlbD family protein n=1 Tax=Priestia filamentosa TaxID=1402861 RepID=UPI002E1D963F|nr:YlbD family protein [Priestia filamentosa]
MAQTKKKLHPKVQEFKAFVKKNPKLIEEVRANRKTWKEFYEDWYLLGEEDEVWNAYKTDDEETKTESSQRDFISGLWSQLKKMDMNQVQHYMSNANAAISSLQGLMQEFSSNTSKSNTQKQQGGGNASPFWFKKD